MIQKRAHAYWIFMLCLAVYSVHNVIQWNWHWRQSTYYKYTTVHDAAEKSNT